MDKLRSTMQPGRASFGSWVSIANPVSADIIGRAGFDWVICDLQHGGIAWGDLLPTMQALALGGTPAIVRTGWNDPMQIMRAVDLGAAGVVVPLVNDEAAARAAVRAIRYPPQGDRSYGPVRSYLAPGGDAAPEPLCLVMIETQQALDNLDEIAAVAGLDGLFVGPVDLALSLGLGAAFVMPDAVLTAVDKVVDACRRHDLIPGCASLGNANARTLMAHGVRFLPVGSDAGYVRRGAAADLAEARSWQASSTSK